VRVCVVGSVSIPLLRSAAPARGTSGPIHPSGGGEIGGADPVRFAWVWLAAGEGRGWIDPMRVEYCLVGVAAQRLGRVDLSACRSNGVGIRSACLFFFCLAALGLVDYICPSSSERTACAGTHASRICCRLTALAFPYGRTASSFGLMGFRDMPLARLMSEREWTSGLVLPCAGRPS